MTPRQRVRPRRLLPPLPLHGISHPPARGDIPEIESVGVEEHFAVAAARPHPSEPPNQRCGPRRGKVSVRGDEPVAPIAPELIELPRNETSEALIRLGGQHHGGCGVE